MEAYRKRLTYISLRELLLHIAGKELNNSASRVNAEQTLSDSEARNIDLDASHCPANTGGLITSHPRRMSQPDIRPVEM